MVNKIYDVAIIDYGLNNLFSVELACQNANLSSIITSDHEVIMSSNSAVLPGVGAFSHAISNIKEKSLDKTILSFIDTGKTFIGICLGMQLLMEKSWEFKKSEGLGVFKGEVLGFEPHSYKQQFFPVPQVGWNKIFKTNTDWSKSVLQQNFDEDFMYFVHSFYVQPENDNEIISSSKYGEVEYCSSISKENVIGMQFHPEKSGSSGLRIYKSLKERIKKNE
tara:strand:+ start:547 stop:1209 length:663 start_codon:yes stop_codon:yes gene_type:complete